MHLNIKNDEAHSLARDLAHLTGESMTAAVTEALRERLERVRHEQKPGLAERLRALGEECARHLRASPRVIGVDDLYDERGLPK